MSTASRQHLCADPPGCQLPVADMLLDKHPGYRVEIIGGVITVTPLPDAVHARVLTDLMLPFLARWPGDDDPHVVQGLGLWLPGGPDDYATPDLSIVDADFDEHLVENNCYDPAVFRLVLEVTSSNYNNDLRNKVSSYAEAKVPVYVIVDRKHGRVHVLTDPVGGTYDSHRVYAPGQSVALPGSIGAEVTLDVAGPVQAGRPRR